MENYNNYEELYIQRHYETWDRSHIGADRQGGRRDFGMTEAVKLISSHDYFINYLWHSASTKKSFKLNKEILNQSRWMWLLFSTYLPFNE